MRCFFLWSTGGVPSTGGLTKVYAYLCDYHKVPHIVNPSLMVEPYIRVAPGHTFGSAIWWLRSHGALCTSLMWEAYFILQQKRNAPSSSRRWHANGALLSTLLLLPWHTHLDIHAITWWAIKPFDTCFKFGLDAYYSTGAVHHYYESRWQIFNEHKPSRKVKIVDNNRKG